MRNHKEFLHSIVNIRLREFSDFISELEQKPYIEVGGGVYLSYGKGGYHLDIRYINDNMVEKIVYDIIREVERLRLEFSDLV